ncbi:hypothetical protein ACHAQD_012448 [Fusarium lateritium]
MKTTYFNIIALAFAAIAGAAANPAPMGMSVDIFERDGVLEVREVVSSFSQSHLKSVFISVIDALSVMEAAMLLSMRVAVGAAITASLDALETDRHVSSGVSKASQPESRQTRSRTDPY